jgi:3-oxoacyl-(acyl-carrier-protein) synthase
MERMKMQMQAQPVAVLGTGLCGGPGASLDEAFAAMLAGRDVFRPITRFDASGYSQTLAGQAEPALESRLRAAYPDEDLAAAFIKEAGSEALRQAGLAPGSLPPRIGLVLATNFGPMEMQEWLWRERLDTGAIDEYSFELWAGFPEKIAAWFGCSGPVAQVSLSCASGAAAAALAKTWLNAGRADAVLAIGYDVLTRFCWTGLHNLHTITTDKVRPFDKRRSGTIFTEGAAAMLLGRLDDGWKPLARLLGAAINNNAFHMTAPSKDAEGSRQAMLAALRDAGLPAENVGHICAHATATVANDQTECAAFRNLFGERLGRMTVAAHKSQIGHLLGAAGLAEAVVTVKVLQGQVCPPTLNLEDQDPACAVVTPQTTMPLAGVRVAITNSAGIGGNNSSLVLGLAEGDGQ